MSTTYSQPELVDAVTHAGMGIIIEIYQSIKSTDNDGHAVERKQYKFSLKRDVQRIDDNGNQMFAFSFFARHVEILQLMLAEAKKRIVEFELHDKYGDGKGIE